MFTYTPELVAELLERRFETADDIETVELFADLDTALTLLSVTHPAAYRLAVAYANGYPEEELAQVLNVEVSFIRQALALVFDHLAKRLNDDPS